MVTIVAKCLAKQASTEFAELHSEKKKKKQKQKILTIAFDWFQ